MDTTLDSRVIGSNRLFKEDKAMQIIVTIFDLDSNLVVGYWFVGFG